MSILTKDQVKDVIELYDIKTAQDAHDAVKDMMKDVLERALDTELSNTLGYDKHDHQNKKTANSRNGFYKKQRDQCQKIICFKCYFNISNCNYSL